MKRFESFSAYGHENIKAVHNTTLEVTKANEVTGKGDCIVAVKASKALKDFDPSFKEVLRKPSATIVLGLEVCDLREEIKGYGDPRLTLTSEEEIVCRKSNFISERTLMVKANKGAVDIDRRIIEKLRNPRNQVFIELLVEC